MMFLLSPSRKQALAKQVNASAESMTKGISLLMVPSPTCMGRTKAVHPIIINTLKILLPTTFPIAISALPWIADSTLITNSGAEVPNATIVSPMTRLEI